MASKYAWYPLFAVDVPKYNLVAPALTAKKLPPVTGLVVEPL